MPLETRVAADGTVQLPTEAVRVFLPDEDVEVVIRPHSVELWRRWSRVRTPRGAEQKGKVVRATAFEVAARRAWKVAERMGSSRDEDELRVAMYIAGYAVECRLKAALCARQGVASLLDAEYRLLRQHGQTYDLTGIHGHRLEVLWDLGRFAELCAPSERVQLRRAFHRANRWSIDWRYGVPSHEFKGAATFFASVASIMAHLEQRR